jgi:hypothetical protein
MRSIFVVVQGHKRLNVALRPEARGVGMGVGDARGEDQVTVECRGGQVCHIGEADGARVRILQVGSGHIGEEDLSIESRVSIVATVTGIGARWLAGCAVVKAEKLYGGLALHVAHHAERSEGCNELDIVFCLENVRREHVHERERNVAHNMTVRRTEQNLRREAGGNGKVR